MTFIAWPEIEAFHQIRKFLRVDPGQWWQQKELLSGSSKVLYRGKVKLHGTNAAVQVHYDGTIVCQSRENIITPEKDNAGFARWVMSNKDAWKNITGFIVYGEWIGPGIQKNVAVSEIPKKCFAVFAARPLDNMNELIVDPAELGDIVDGLACSPIEGVHVLPWHTINASDSKDARVYAQVEVDWKRTDEELSTDIVPINQWVLDVEAEDPWVNKTFGVKGTGEGLVFYPVSENHLGFESFQNLCFKAKGEKHKNIKTAAPAQVNPETAASVSAFVELVLTPARLEQGARAILGEHKHEEVLNCLFCTTGALTYNMKDVGKFITWVNKDVEKETMDELEASKLDLKQVQKAITTKARTWFLEKAK